MRISNLSSKDFRKLFSNFTSLSLLQFANLILPIITFPYLVRTIGVEKYGLLMFAQAFIGYFTLISDYGFNLSGIREISLNRNNINKLTTIYNSILSLRLMLSLFGFFIMSILVFSIDKFLTNWELYFLTYGLILGNALFPTWFFHGIEKMKLVTILTVVAKLIFTLAIFIFVKSESDYLLVPILNSFGYIISGLISLYIVNRKFKIKFKVESFNAYRNQLVQGWYIFISKISTNIYTITTTFILGLATNNTAVGYYTIAEKVIRIIVGLFSPLIQTIYPYFIQLVQNSRKKSVIFLNTVIRLIIPITIFILIFTLIFTEQIFNIVFTDITDQSIHLFRVLSPLIIVIPIAGVVFNVALLGYKLDKTFLKAYTFGALLNIILLYTFLFKFNFGSIGAAYSLLICEIGVTSFGIIYLYRNKVSLFSNNLLFNK